MDLVTDTKGYPDCHRELMMFTQPSTTEKASVSAMLIILKRCRQGSVTAGCGLERLPREALDNIRDRVVFGALGVVGCCAFGLSQVLSTVQPLQGGPIVHRAIMESALLAACSRGHVECLSFLFDNGASTRWCNNTLLITAGRYGHNGAVQFLLSRGAVADAHDGECLMLACQCGRLDVVETLVSAGARVDREDGDALMSACRSGHKDIVQYLVSKGADASVNDWASLLVAAEGGHLDIVRFLVATAGADVNACDGMALQVAEENGHREVAEYLESLVAEF